MAEEESKKMMRDFSELPGDVLAVIAEKLPTPSDLVWFGAVCVSWRLAASMENNNPKHCKLPSSSLPVLLLPSPSPSTDVDDDDEQEQDETDDENTDLNQQIEDDDDDDDDDDDYDYDYENENENENENPYPPTPTPEVERKTNTITRSLYSLYDGKVHDCELDVGGDCRSSSHGWLVVTTEADQNYTVRLLNPFKSFNNVIELPPLTTFHLERGTLLWNSAHLVKAAFSGSPSSSCSNPKDIVVMAIHGCFRLSFCRPGDKSWTALPDEWNVFQDVIYYNGLFYAILQTGKLFAIEIDPLHSKLKDFKVLIDVPRGEIEKKYIVESAGELLQVKRKIDHDGNIFKYKTVYFKVFKLDQTIQTGSEWVEIKTLNGRSLFLGHNASISLLASDVPGCKPNCIYFTDDRDDIFLCYPSRCCHHDMGIYNLEDGSFVPHYRMQTKTNTPHPIWIQPTL